MDDNEAKNMISSFNQRHDLHKAINVDDLISESLNTPGFTALSLAERGSGSIFSDSWMIIEKGQLISYKGGMPTVLASNSDGIKKELKKYHIKEISKRI